MAFGQCNGDPDLCSRRYDEVCYATTHNAFNYQGAFLFPNQSYEIAQQMQDGVRGLMLDVYWYNNRPTVYHSSNFLGNQPLSDLLADIQTFLDANPTEILTIIFESYITAAQMNDAFTQAALIPYLHAQPQGDPWPTLQQMIDANQRLVVLTDVNDGQAYPWYHYVWNYGVETHYTAHSRQDFSCDYNRGDSTKSLFILNHFITQSSLGYGMIDSAAAVNANPYLTSRAMACWTATGKMPNFLTVDFYEQGDVMAAKDAINTGLVSAESALNPTTGWALGQNPVHESIALYTQDASNTTTTFKLIDLQGRIQLEIAFAPQAQRIIIPVPTDLPNGPYIYQLQSNTNRTTGKLLLLR
jgi:hypothetical protein